jgi:hypothetical protein
MLIDRIFFNLENYIELIFVVMAIYFPNRVPAGVVRLGIKLNNSFINLGF